MNQYGKNVSAKVDGNKMIIEIDLTQDHGMSASGKTHVIASTCGNVKIDSPQGQIMLGLNVNKK